MCGLGPAQPVVYITTKWGRQNWWQLFLGKCHWALGMDECSRWYQYNEYFCNNQGDDFPNTFTFLWWRMTTTMNNVCQISNGGVFKILSCMLNSFCEFSWVPPNASSCYRSVCQCAVDIHNFYVCFSQLINGVRIQIVDGLIALAMELRLFYAIRHRPGPSMCALRPGRMPQRHDCGPTSVLWISYVVFHFVPAFES